MSTDMRGNPPPFYCQYYSGCIPSESVKNDHDNYLSELSKLGVTGSEIIDFCTQQCKECAAEIQKRREKQ